jgi:hypothetical protein
MIKLTAPASPNSDGGLPPPKTTGLRFSPLSANQIHLVPHISEMSPQQVRATWYNADDLAAVKLSCVGMIQQMAGKGVVGVEETTEQTTRGLEHKTKGGNANASASNQASQVWSDVRTTPSTK